MEKLFSISETAKIVGMTTETLRHYDRIGLCLPCKVDDNSGYRYYSEQEIVRLKTISALKNMDLSLEEINKALNLNNFKEILDFLNKAEKSADEKNSALGKIKARIIRAKNYYEMKCNNNDELDGIFIQDLPARTIMIAPNLTEPTVSNLWNYHRHFYAQLDSSRKKDFDFEDLAGVINENGKTNMFTICTRFKNHPNLKTLPAGKYLCSNCKKENSDQNLNEMLNIAKAKYNVVPNFIIQIIVLTGILQWDYQLQLYLSK